MTNIKFEIPEMTRVDIKPMSVNEAWQGKRFKAPQYKKYEKDALILLPKILMPLGKLKIVLEFGVSNVCSDIDNGIKPFVDILQRKYNFNDRDIYEMEVKKIKTEKGKEFIKFCFISIKD